MAKKQIKEKSIEETLWESANKLRGSVEPLEYKHVVLSIIFLKYAYDRFTERRNELVAEGKGQFADNPVFYNAKNVFYLEPESRWDFLIENAKQNDIAIKIDKALAKVEEKVVQSYVKDNGGKVGGDVPSLSQALSQVLSQVCPKLDVSHYPDAAAILIALYKEPQSLKELMEKTKEKNRGRIKENVLQHLCEFGLIERR